MSFISGDLLRRGHNHNNVPIRQVFAYLENFEDFTELETPMASIK